MYKGEGLLEESSSCRYVGMENGGMGIFGCACGNTVGSGSGVAVGTALDALVSLSAFGCAIELTLYSADFNRRFSELEFLLCIGVVTARDESFGRVMVKTGIAVSVIGVVCNALLQPSSSAHVLRVDSCTNWSFRRTVPAGSSRLTSVCIADFPSGVANG